MSVTVLSTDRNASRDEVTRPGTPLRWAVAAGLAGILAASVATGATQISSTTRESTTSPVALASSSAQLETAQLLWPSYCIFGTHHGKGSGCRGGGVAKGFNHVANKCGPGVAKGAEFGGLASSMQPEAAPAAVVAGGVVGCAVGVATR